MRRARISMILLIGACLSLSVFAGSGRHGIGLGESLGTFAPDGDREEVDFTGYTLFAKIGLSGRWGIFLSYKDLDLDTNEKPLLTEADAYTQAVAHLYRLWRPDMKIRPHAGFGLAWTEFETDSPAFPGLSDSGIGVSLGAGVELGSPEFAFLIDYQFTRVDLFGESFDLDDLMTGIILKF